MPRRKACNDEKSWLAILREIKKEKGEAAAWLYATALRGPDDYDAPWYVKAVFTGPLRGCKDFVSAVADVSAYHWCAKRPDNVRKAFRFLMKNRHTDHYLKHLIAAWEVLELKVAKVLTRVLDVKRRSRALRLDDISSEYMLEVARWLRRTNAVSEEESKDE